jgi:hypothetical protein
MMKSIATIDLEEVMFVVIVILKVKTGLRNLCYIGGKGILSSTSFGSGDVMNRCNIYFKP